jgi:hypothetical protein
MLRVSKGKSATLKRWSSRAWSANLPKKASQLNFERGSLQASKEKLGSQTTQQKYSAWNRGHIPILILFAAGIILQIARALV